MTADRYLDVLEPGLLATVQDRGRPGQADIGVSPSGAADRAALARANRLVGNRVDAAGIEATFGGLVVQAGEDLIVTVTGAHGHVEVDGRPVGGNATVHLRRNAVLRLGRPERAAQLPGRARRYRRRTGAGQPVLRRAVRTRAATVARG